MKKNILLAVCVLFCSVLCVFWIRSKRLQSSSEFLTLETEIQRVPFVLMSLTNNLARDTFPQYTKTLCNKISSYANKQKKVELLLKMMSISCSAPLEKIKELPAVDYLSLKRRENIMWQAQSHLIHLAKDLWIILMMDSVPYEEQFEPFFILLNDMKEKGGRYWDPELMASEIFAVEWRFYNYCLHGRHSPTSRECEKIQSRFKAIVGRPMCTEKEWLKARKTALTPHGV